MEQLSETGQGPVEGAPGRVETRPELPDWRWLAGAVVLLAVLGIAAFSFWRSGVRAQDLAALGYPGIFLMMLVTGAGLPLPMANQASVFLAGALWNPILVGIVAGLGNSTGELAGYGAGKVGSVALRDRASSRWSPYWARLRRWFDRYGFFAVLAMAAVPNPIFDVVGILAGSTGYPVRRFWVACVIGNTAKYTAIALLGDVAQAWMG